MLELLMSLAFSPAAEIVRGNDAELVTAEVIRLDGREIRLWGLNVPEPGVPCADTQVSDAPYACEAAARDVLQDSLDGVTVSVRVLAERNDPADPDAMGINCVIVGQDPDGRAVGRCEIFTPSCFSHGAGCTDDWADLAGLVIASGAAASRPDEAGETYDREEANVCFALMGVWGAPSGAGVVEPVDGPEDC